MKVVRVGRSFVLSSSSVPSPSRFRKWIKRLGLLGVVMLLLGAAAIWFFTRPGRVAALAELMLESLTGASAQVEAGHLHLDGRVDLHQVRLSVPNDPALPGAAAEVFSGDRVAVRVDPSTWGGGPLRLMSVDLVGPVLSLTEMADGSYAFQRLAVPSETGAGAGTDQIARLPMVRIERGRLRCGRVGTSGYQEMGVLPIRGRLEPDPKQIGQYRFEFQEQTLEGERVPEYPIQLTGTLDPTQGAIHAKVPRLALDSPYVHLLPGRVLDWWLAHEPGGVLEEVQLDYASNHEATVAGRISDGSLVLPEFSTKMYRTRMADVKGTFSFTPEHVEVDLSGRVDELRYEIKGRINGYGPEAPFELTLKTKPFEITEKPQYLAALPEEAQRLFAAISPNARVIVNTSFWRRTPGGPIGYRGVAEFLDGRGLLEMFPYALTNAHGLIEFGSDFGVRIKNLEADTASGAVASVSGLLGLDGKVELTVRARDLPFDDALYQALPENTRKVLDLFFSRTEHARLKAHGHLNGEDGPFELGGRCHAVIRIEHVAGKRETDVHVDLELVEASAMVRDFPYPLRVKSGHLVFASDHARLENVRADGWRGGTIGLEGRVDLTPSGSDPRLQLAIVALPMDDLLIDVISKRDTDANIWMRRLRPEGKVDASGEIFLDETGHVDLAIMVDILGGRLRPGGGQFELTDVEGRLRLRRDRVEIEQLSGSRAEGLVVSSGVFDWSDAKRPHRKMRVEATQLHFEDHLMDLFAPLAPEGSDLERLWQAHKPAGVFDAEIDFESSGDIPESYRVTVRPRSLNFIEGDDRVALTSMRGSIQVMPDRIIFDQVEADHGTGHLAGHGWMSHDAVTEGRMAIRLSGDCDDQRARRLLPKAIEPIVRTLKIQNGRFDLDLVDLVWHGKEAQAEVTARGGVKLERSQVQIGLPCTDLTGRITFDMHQPMDASHPDLDIEIMAEQVAIYGRALEGMHVTLRSTMEDQRLLIHLRDGRLAGGRISGVGAYDPASGRYRLKAECVDSDLPVLLRGASGDSPLTRGRASFTMDLQGNAGDRASTRGQGEMLVRDADLVGVPLMMGLARMSHLGLPVTDPLDHGTMRYHVRGDRFVLEQFELASPAMSLQGGGAVHLDDGRVDLLLTTTNPSGLRLGSLTDLIDRVRNQIVAIRISGTLENPVTELSPFLGVRTAWDHAVGHAGR